MEISRRAFGVGAVSTLVGLQSACTPTKKYNVVLIVADDLGPQIGAYGDMSARTPNLDAFAAQSIVYESAYVTQASCSPSRASIFTGLHPHENGQLGLAQFGFHLKPGVASFPKQLQKAGVYTGNIGKIHVGPEGRIGFSYDQRGRETTRDPDWVEARLNAFFKGRNDKNFFLMANLMDPHRPFDGSFDMLPSGPRTAAQVKPLPFIPIDGPNIRMHAAGFYNCVERFDYLFGRILDVLDKEGLSSSTAVIFIGDHGPEFFRSKGTCYEAGVRIPLMVRLPQMQKGFSTPKLASTIDLAPTICDLLGVEWRQGDGLLLSRPEAIPEDRLIITEFTAHEPKEYFPRRSIRDKRYKLCWNLLSGQPPPIGVDFAFHDILVAMGKRDPRVSYLGAFLKTPGWEFYDLKSDPWEEKDILKDPAAGVVIRHLRKALAAWQIRTSDPLQGLFPS